MKRIKIKKAKKIEIPKRSKGERKASYERRVEAIKMFNWDCEKYLGRTVEIERFTQAIGIYDYAGASGPGACPAHFQSRISLEGELFFTTGYSKMAKLNIL